MEIPPLDGPRRIGARGQLTLPPQFMEQLGIEAGADVWVGINPDRPTTIVVVPRALAMELLRKGWTALS